MPMFDGAALVEAALNAMMATVRNPAVRAVILSQIRPPRDKRPRPGLAGDGVPTDPRRPSSLSGGAAAALTFEN